MRSICVMNLEQDSVFVLCILELNVNNKGIESEMYYLDCVSMAHERKRDESVSATSKPSLHCHIDPNSARISIL